MAYRDQKMNNVSINAASCPSYRGAEVATPSRVIVIPAKAGIQNMDSRLKPCGNDNLGITLLGVATVVR